MSELRAFLKKASGVRARVWLIPAALALAALALLAGGGMNAPDSGVSPLEARLERVLASVEGAGNVRAMVLEGDAGVSGVLVVAEGAKDVAVRLRLQSAVCTLLGIDNSAVNVAPMEGYDNGS